MAFIPFNGLFITLLGLLFINYTQAQCPNLQPPCRCAPSIYEPVSIVCENAGSLANVLQAISGARETPVSLLFLFYSFTRFDLHYFCIYYFFCEKIYRDLCDIRSHRFNLILTFIF